MTARRTAAALTLTAAALLGASAVAAANPGQPALHDVPAFAKGVNAEIGWSAVAFSPKSMGRGYEVEIRDQTGSDDSDFENDPDDLDRSFTMVDGHLYSLRVRAFENECIAEAAGICIAYSPIRSNSAWSAPKLTRADATAPQGTLAINGGSEYTNDPEVVLDMAATDPAGAIGQPSAGVDAVQISQTGVFACTPLDATSPSCPLDFTPQRTITLSDGPDGPRTVNVRFRDASRTVQVDGLVSVLHGNGSATVSDTIVLDRQAPTPVVTQSAATVPVGASLSLSAVASVDGLGGPADSGVDPDGATWSFGDGTVASGLAVAKSYGAPGTYAGTLTLTDRAGNTSSAPFAVHVVAPPAPPSVAGDEDLLLAARRIGAKPVAGRGVRFRVVTSRRTTVRATLLRIRAKGRLSTVVTKARTGGPGPIVITLTPGAAGRYQVRLRSGDELITLPLKVGRR